MSKPRLIVFDINHTLIEDNSWLNMNLALGVSKEEDRVLWSLNQEGILPNKTWVEVMNRLYKERGKATRKNIETAIFTYTYRQGAKDLIMELKKQGYTVALLSGAMDLLVERIAKELDVDLFGFGSYLFFDESDNLKEMVYIAEDTELKKMLFLSFCRRLELNPRDVVCVGDGDNEAELFKLSRGITFRGSKLEAEAWKIVENLTDIPAILEV